MLNKISNSSVSHFLHSIIVFILFVVSFLLSSIFPVFNTLWPFIFVYDGLIEYLSKFTWWHHSLFYASFMCGFLWILQDADWGKTLIIGIGSYLLGRLLGRYAKSLSDNYRLSAEEEDVHKAYVNETRQFYIERERREAEKMKKLRLAEKIKHEELIAEVQKKIIPFNNHPSDE